MNVGFHFVLPAYQLVDREAWPETVARVITAKKGITELAEDQLEIPSTLMSF
jgi:hypothetical protein